MNKLFRDKAFKLGFLISMFFTAGLNIIYLKLISAARCSYCRREVGFPFRFYEDFNNAHLSGADILWSGLIADLLFAAAISLIIGLIFKFVRTRISSSLPHLK